MNGWSAAQELIPKQIFDYNMKTFIVPMTNFLIEYGFIFDINFSRTHEVKRNRDYLNSSRTDWLDIHIIPNQFNLKHFSSWPQVWFLEVMLQAMVSAPVFLPVGCATQSVHYV